MTGPRKRGPKVTAKGKFQWTRNETLALAQQSCTFCFGLGMRPGRSGNSTPCKCVFRAIFRACYERFRTASMREGGLTRTNCGGGSNGGGRGIWSMKHEEYAADFCLVSARALDETQHRIFRYHYLLGADWKLCCRKLGIVRGEFFHEVYRIEQILGRTFRELRPYALFPLDEYFNSAVRKDPNLLGYEADEEAAPAAEAPLDFPLRYKCA